ncbi:MAG: hypothetical protein Rubg2KO_34620 [Rubricoccaceae bacterium]
MKVFALLLATLCFAAPASAQLEDDCRSNGINGTPSRDRATTTPSGLASSFDGIFTFFLRDALRLAGNPGQHGDHYLDSSCLAERVLVPSLSNFIAANVTSFPSSSPQIGVTYDFSTGVPVRQIESLGPIFSETPGTIGKNRLTLGANISVLTLNTIRGEPLSGAEFNFVHENIDSSTDLGESEFERDLLVVRPRLNVDAVIYGLFANYGISDQFDVGVAIPVVSLTLEGRAEAEIIAYSGGDPHLHFFDGDQNDPLLVSDYPYSSSETFVPALDVRAKYQMGTQGTPLGVIGTLSIPTSGEGSLLGERDLGARVALVGSTTLGTFRPHANVGYDMRGTEGDADAVQIAVGLDANLSTQFNLAGALLASVPIEDPIRFFDTEANLGDPGSAIQFVQDVGPGGSLQRVEEPFSTIEDENDTAVLLSLGSRFAPTEKLQGFVNVLIPVVSGGLQSTLVPTVGLSASL